MAIRTTKNSEFSYFGSTGPPPIFNPDSSCLPCRFGLYGHPLEQELFDLEPPHLTKPSTAGSITYASIVGGATQTASQSVASASTDETDFKVVMCRSIKIYL